MRAAVDDPADDAVPSDDAGDEEGAADGMRAVDDPADDAVPSDDAGDEEGAAEWMRAVDDPEHDAVPSDNEEDDMPLASSVESSMSLLICSHVEGARQTTNIDMHSLVCYIDWECSTKA